MKRIVRFLAHTRSQSFDYSWLYGIPDKGELRRLEERLQAWLGVTHLAALPPVSVFFEFNGKLILMMARQSPERFDSHRRPIFERALFYWDPGSEPITYGYLSPMYLELLSLSQRIFGQVPNDEIRFPMKSLEIELDLSSQKAPQANPEWEIPPPWLAKDLLANAVIVKTPTKWNFTTLVFPIRDLSITQGRIISLGSSLPLDNVIGSKGSWVISPPPGDLGLSNEIQVVGMDNKPIPWEASLEDSSFAVMQAGANSIDRPEGPKDDLDELSAQLFVHTTERYRHAAQARLGFMAGGEKKMRSALLKLSLLVLPVRFEMNSQLAVAWSNLLMEMSLLRAGSDGEIERHWLQRLEALKRMSLATYGSRSHDWAENLESACSSLKKELLS